MRWLFPLIGCLCFLLASCDVRPGVSKEDNASAKQRVASGHAELLDGTKINQIIRAANASDVSQYASKVLELDGSVVQRDISESDSASGSAAEITLQIHDPDYEAVRFECAFAPDDEAKVKSLNIGSKVRIKGEFQGASSSTINLIGCIVEDAPTATKGNAASL